MELHDKHVNLQGFQQSHIGETAFITGGALKDDRNLLSPTDPFVCSRSRAKYLRKEIIRP